MKKHLLLIVMAMSLLTACKKESQIRYDWILVDNLGNEGGTVRNKTEDELRFCNTCGRVNGNDSWNLTPCQYFRADEQRFYWEVKNPGDTAFSGNYYMTEKILKCTFARGSQSQYRKK